MSTKNQVNKICTDCNQEFIIDEGDLVLYEKVGIEPRNQCFECLMAHQSSFWPFGKFRKGVSSLSGESLITILPEKSRYPIYKSKEWWGDAWDPMEYGQVYDPNRSFFEQLKELQEKVPRAHQTGENNVDCDWCDDVWESKHCYLSRSLFRGENLIYGYRLFNCKDSCDLVLSFNIQNSYDCLACQDSFNLNFSENSRDCVDSHFLFDCRNCQNCFMSWNLRNKNYCIRNKQYSKEDYEKEMAKIKLSSFSEIEKLKSEFADIVRNSVVHREKFNLKTNNSIGNYLTNCDKCVNVFFWEDSQNCRNQLRGQKTKDCIDQMGSWRNEMSGNNSCVTGGYGIKYSVWSDARYSEYVDNCNECEYCFGCVGLKKKKYCILNKQYTKEEYETLKLQIIENMKNNNEYGKFMPYSMSLCDFNLSTGVVYFPDVSKDKIKSLGGYWSEEDLSSNDGLSSSTLPDDINNTDKSICSQALICTETGYRFNISPGEYDFHKRKGMALPRTHFDFRIIKKARRTATIKSSPYKCFYCKKDINAYYPPEWGYKNIACEECYKQNVS